MQGSQDAGYVSIAEAAVLFGVSEATLRRRTLRGEVAGSFKIRGKRGREWRLPVSSLRSLGYEETSPSEDLPPDRAELEASILNLRETLRVERARWDEWDRRLGWARAEIARLESDLKKERERNGELQARLLKARSGGAVIDLDTETSVSRPSKS